MGSKEYGGISAGSASTAYAALDQLTAGARLGGNDSAVIRATLGRLEQGQPVEDHDLDRSVQVTLHDVPDPTCGNEAVKVISGLYDLGRTAANQARVVGNLLGPETARLVGILVDGEHSLLYERLGADGMARLLRLAAEPNPVVRSSALLEWAHERLAGAGQLPAGQFPAASGLDSAAGTVADKPRLADERENPGTTELKVVKISSEPFRGLQTALLENDTATLAALLDKAPNIDELARAAAALGEEARGPLQRLTQQGTPAQRQFAFQALRNLAETKLTMQAPQEARSDSGSASRGGAGGQIINVAALEEMIARPGAIPATLVSRIGSSTEVQATAFQLIVGP